MADVTKITLPNGTTKDIKDATARAQVLIVANQSTQYNHVPVKTETKTLGAVTFVANAMTGVINVNGDNTSGSYQDYELPVLTLAAGTYKMLSYSGVSAATIVGFILKSEGTTIATEWGNSGVFTLAAPATITPVIRAWNGANINNVNVKPFVILKSLYDAGFTDYQPYALPNTKITPELIELVDSGAKNELELITPYGRGITNNPNLTVTLNADQTITVNGSVTTSGVIVISNTISGKLGKYLSGRPAGVTADIRLTAYSQPNWSTAGNDYNGKGATITDNGNILITIYVIAGQTYSNLTFNPMLCSKAAWDVSQKYVPYRPTYEETVKQVAENENNILTFCICDYTETAFTATTPNSYEYTGISFTVPAHEVYEFRIADRYTGNGNNFSTGLIIADSSTNIDVNATIIAENTDVNSQSGKSYWMRQVSGLTPIRNSDTTYYIWVNRGSFVSSYIIKCLRRVY